MTTIAPPPASATPVQLTEFVGRQQELGTLRELLTTSRLLTLTGAGGSGKTRLALAVVEQRLAADDGQIAWIELAPLSAPGALARHLALALGVRVEGGGSAEQALTAMLRSRPVLLVLDNCEHLVDECARIADHLLRECPMLRILATSREALGIGGERSWLVPALSLPDAGAACTPETTRNAESVQLFIERAREVLPAFSLTASNAAAVARICRRLDGLPLAIELAAARVGVLTPTQIAERLDESFALLSSSVRTALPRHRTLDATISWSYDLLSADERSMLERLAVFVGGFTLDAAEHVCAGGAIRESRVLDLLASLVMRSLVTMQEENGRARYRLLETIRDYASARRRSRGDDSDTDGKHALYFLSLARDLEPELILGRPERLRQMDIEHDNVRAALAWSARHEQGTQCGLPLCWAAMWFWFHRQLWHEGFKHFERALGTATDPTPELRAAALHALGIFGLYAANPNSRERLIEAESIWRASGNLRWLAFTLVCRTVEASLRKNPAEARALADETVSVARMTGDAWISALAAVHALVPVLSWEQDWHTAEQRLSESEHTYRNLGYAIGMAYVLDTRAYVAFRLADHARAARLACESLRTDPQIESRWLAGRSLRTLGAVAFARDRLEDAAQLFGAAAGMYEAIGADPLSAERGAVNELPERIRATMPIESFSRAWATGRDSSFQAAIAFALGAGEKLGGSLSESTVAIDDTGAAEPSIESVRDKHRERLSVKALGPLQILRGGKPLEADSLHQARPRELLLFLLTHPDGRTREQIGLSFWPDVSPAQVKNNFHVTLHHLRKAIGGKLIKHERGRYVIDPECGVEFDVAHFERDVRAASQELGGKPSRRKATAISAEAAYDLRKALACYRGEFLEGESVGDWADEIRESLARLREEALRVLAAHHEDCGEHTAAATLWEQLVTTDPLNEDAGRRLMLALSRDGRRHEALRSFDRLERTLADELDVPPDRESVRLAERIRRGDTV